MNFGNLYTSFEGRISRKPFWIGFVPLVAVMVGILFLSLYAVGEQDLWVFRLNKFIVMLIFMYPLMALGVKRRMALAAALMHEPDILFLDEPTSGVDPLARREFWARIGTLADEGVAILVTSHFMDEADYCDRLGIIDAGKLIASDTPAGLRERVRSAELPDPTLEDAFIALVGQSAAARATA